MTRRPKKAIGGSLDSLLDTMTNVVGILVILLVVTQLGVRDAVHRIGQSSELGAETVERMTVEVTQVRRERQQLEQQLRIANTLDPVQRLGQIQQLVENARQDLRKLRSRNEVVQRRRQEEIDEAESLDRELRQREQELIEQIAKSQDEVAGLRARLEQMPVRRKVPPKIVHLPNPRRAPQGARAVYLVCRDQRVMLWDRDRLRQVAENQALLTVARKQLAADPRKGVEAEKLIYAFNRLRIKDSWFLLQIKATDRTPILVFQRQSSAGESLTQIQRRRAEYRQILQRIDPRRHYLRFTVWSDSFEVYLAARRIASELGLAAGWGLSSAEGEIEMPLGGTLRFGPPPPPPKSPKVAVKPRAKPKQPARVVPVDTVD